MANYLCSQQNNQSDCSSVGGVSTGNICQSVGGATDGSSLLCGVTTRDLLILIAIILLILTLIYDSQ